MRPQPDVPSLPASGAKAARYASQRGVAPSATPDPNRSPRLPVLDGLRGLAAIGIVLFHLPGLAITPWMFDRFYLLVDVFFLLSGFVMALSAEPRLAAGWSTTDFMTARVRRLWPTMALGIGLGAIAFLGRYPPSQIVPFAVFALLFLPVLGTSGLAYPINGPEWSLTWELVANLVHALVLRRLSDRTLIVVAAVSGVALAITAYEVGCGCAGPNAANWYLAAPRVAWAYTLGIVLARRWRQHAFAPVLDWKWALAAPMLTLMLLPWLPLTQAQGDTLMTVLVLPGLFWLICIAKPPEQVSRGLEKLGAMSFPLYATHPAALLACGYLGQSKTMLVLGLMAALGCACVIAWAASQLKRQRSGAIMRRTDRLGGGPSGQPGPNAFCAAPQASPPPAHRPHGAGRPG